MTDDKRLIEDYLPIVKTTLGNKIATNNMATADH